MGSVMQPVVMGAGGGGGGLTWTPKDGATAAGKTMIGTIELPDTLASVAAQGFSGWTGLTSITLPSGITTIGDYAFDGCSSLTSLVIPSGVTALSGSSIFSACSSLASVTLPSGLTDMSGAYLFQGCGALTSLTLPSGLVGWIGGYSLNNTALTTLTIPAGITNIGSYAFPALTELVMLPTSPPGIYPATLASVTATCSIRVPAASVAAYQAASYWSDRAAYISAI